MEAPQIQALEAKKEDMLLALRIAVSKVRIPSDIVADKEENIAQTSLKRVRELRKRVSDEFLKRKAKRERSKKQPKKSRKRQLA